MFLHTAGETVKQTTRRAERSSLWGPASGLSEQTCGRKVSMGYRSGWEPDKTCTQPESAPDEKRCQECKYMRRRGSHETWCACR